MRTLSTAALLCGVLLGATSHATLVRTADAEIRGTWQYDFDAGTEVLSGGEDVHWQQINATTRALTIGLGGGALLYAFGSVDFNAITEGQLLALAYTADPIAGPPAVGSPLQIGDAFAVFTTQGNYVKAIVTGYDNGTADRPFYDLQIRYALYDGNPVTGTVPEPTSTALLCLGLAGLAWQGRRRSRPGAR
jgi:hypothetical protein